MRRVLFGVLLSFVLFSLSGCEACNRDIKQVWSNSMTGTNWLVVELRFDGTPYRCWELRDVSIAQEQGSDGIYWEDPETGNLIHVSGSYDYVQVTGGDWSSAFRQINMTDTSCEKVRDRLYKPEKGAYFLPDDWEPASSETESEAVETESGDYFQ